LESLNYIGQILVVVDGSTDNTLQALQGLPSAVTILAMPKNQGKGAALKAGFQEARRLGWDYAITMDSDGQHNPKHICDFIQAIEKNPLSIVIGDRDMSAVNIPKASKFGKKFTNFWIQVETGVKVSDGQSGFRAYPIAQITKIKTWFNRYEFEVEILTKAIWTGIRVTAIPISVEYHPEGGRVSHFRPFMDNLRTSILNTILVLLCLPHRIQYLIQRKRRKWNNCI
jgi:glycosyltransferase involved in cell wall biosynthesis